MLVEIDGLTKTYLARDLDDTGAGPVSASAAAAQLKVLRDLEWRVEAGSTSAVLGPSGSGKSTLLNILGALERPDAGRIRVDGQDLATMDERALALYRNQTVGFVFQLHHLLPQCSVLENVLVPTLAGGSPGTAAMRDRARELLDAVGLGNRLQHRPAELSGGERQRVAVARALINRPKLLLADEPTGALDRATAALLVDLLLELNRSQGTTLIVVTHAAEVARRMQRVFELRDGALVPVAIES